MIDRTPPNEMPPANETNIREVRSSSGASWFLAGLVVVVVIVGGIFLFGEELGFGGPDTNIEMNASPPATQPQSEPAPQTAPESGASGEDGPSPTAPASE